MYVTFTILNYPKYFFFAGFFSMIFFRLALFKTRKKSFTKLMGTGKNGSFDLMPDLCQWTVMEFKDDSPEIFNDTDPTELLKKLHGNFIAGWVRFFKCETGLFIMKVTEGHGAWDRNPMFQKINKSVEEFQPIAVLTRATIRFSKISAFWKQVPLVNKKIAGAKGLLFSIGTGEAPVVRQATFSVWKSRQSMKDYAYNDEEHLQAIRKTREEKWYTEELFLRLKIILVSGTVKGKPLSSLTE